MNSTNLLPVLYQPQEPQSDPDNVKFYDIQLTPPCVSSEAYLNYLLLHFLLFDASLETFPEEMRDRIISYREKMNPDG